MPLSSTVMLCQKTFSNRKTTPGLKRRVLRWGLSGASVEIDQLFVRGIAPDETHLFDDLWRRTTINRVRYMTLAYCRGVFHGKQQAEYRKALAETRRASQGGELVLDEAHLWNTVQKLVRDNFHLYRASLPPDQHREPPNQQRYQELLSHMQGYQHECSRFCPCNRVATQLSYLGRLFSHRGGGSCRILCFGLGSLEENGAGGPTFNLGAIKRHIVAGHVAARLQRLAAKKDSPATTTAAAYDGMHLFFDDPAYTARDRSFVRKCLPTVLDPAGPAISIGMANPALGQPQSFSQINSNTLVLAVHPEFPVRQLVMEMCTPAAMLWSDHMDSPLETTYDIESFYVRLRPDEPAGPATGGNLHSLLVPGTPIADPLPSHLRDRLLAEYQHFPTGYRTSLYIRNDILTSGTTDASEPSDPGVLV